jgi:solute:Na+ symporter, SSS family
MGLLLVGLVMVAWLAFGALAGGDPAAGLARLAHETPTALLEPIPTEKLTAFLGWLGLLAAGSLGNIPSQDLVQRIFASRSERVARHACYLAGGGYLVFGVIPPLLGLTARLLAPEGDRAILPLLAGLVLHPLPAVIFVLAVVSAVLSTIDSAILAPASVLAQNVFPRTAPERLARRLTPLGWNQLSVVGVAAASLAVAFVGENAYSLLESAYEIGLVSLLVPLAVGLYSSRGGERSALAAMGVGTGLWLAHLALGWQWFAAPLLAERGIFLPMGLSCAALALCAYGAAALPSRP